MKRTPSLSDHSSESLQVLLASLCDGFSATEAGYIQTAFQTVLTVSVTNVTKPRGIEIAEILKSLNVDAQTIQAALLSDPYLRDAVADQKFLDQYGAETANLVRNVNWLNTFHDFSPDTLNDPEQTETLRKMLLAMVDDIRAMLIKLAYRVQRLHLLSAEEADTRHYIARETMDIYAPLANRLGIGQLKWQLEDLAFRYLEPNTYKRIASALAERREERQSYLQRFTRDIQALLDGLQIQAQVYGRPKHIYSIWNKMRRKKVELSELYDLRAIRIIVDQVVTCYTVLGLMHSHWQYIPQEFDDYIANQKANGYQSLHTVIIGPEGALIEIQIRTREMDEFSELGVAAHWRYKEGGKQDAILEASIASLRALLTDQNSSVLVDFQANLYADRIFVLTPKGEVKDLARGATPLDFAYAIHTEVGHRCRGAKINGRIMPLTYQMRSGDQVEILTGKEDTPRQSWLNSSAGYLHTSQAISKVKAWFRQQDFNNNVEQGKQILEREKRRLNVKRVDLPQLSQYFHMNRPEEVLATIGRAEISLSQLATALLKGLSNQSEQPMLLSRPKTDAGKLTGEITVTGIGNLMTTFPQCCKPVPGDPIIGYITQGKGITIHRQDCHNILQLPQEKMKRLIDVNWGAEETTAFQVEIQVRAFDRQGLLRDMTEILSGLRVNILELNTSTNIKDLSVNMLLRIEVRDAAQLSQVLERLNQLHNVFEARRADR